MSVLDQLKQLSDARFAQIYAGLEHNGFGPLDGDVAKALKFRPQAIKKLPMDQRARRARSILLSTRNAEMTYEVFGAYLLRNQKGLVTGFLDKTGVDHRDGMIEDLDAVRPDDGKISAAIAELDTSFAPDDVTLYLAMCTQHWPDCTAITSAWKKRAGV
ncbi:MAG: hypothetical protein FJ299_16060 [Planctomycetes bacterium]|nr:hypothetical protein [Planctomycetota bacterium]